ncbi:MAG: flagellar filament capping protein FliD, partial [Tepidisphaeraceae bacterium]
DVGVRLTTGTKLEFDEQKFRDAYAADPEAVKALFTTLEKGIGHIIEKKATKLTDPVDGVITRENKSLDEKTRQFQSRISALDKLLEGKRTRLERQFAQLESVLAGLQNQQASLGQIQTIAPRTNS